MLTYDELTETPFLDAQDCEDEMTEDEMTEDDITTEDHLSFYQYGRLVVQVTEDEDAPAALRAYMDAQSFWPNVWSISDHGNVHAYSWS